MKKKKQAKQEIVEKLEEIYPYPHSGKMLGPLENVIKYLQKKLVSYQKNGFYNIYIDKEITEYSDREERCIFTRYYLYGTRIETDEEFNKRVPKTDEKIKVPIKKRKK